MRNLKRRWIRFDPKPLSKLFATGFEDFTAAGCRGLAAIRGDWLYVLAIQATAKGSGRFREFLNLAMRDFGRVIFLHVGSDLLRSVLTRHGFAECKIELDGEKIDAMACQRPAAG